jgi:hypothetical protein
MPVSERAEKVLEAIENAQNATVERVRNLAGKVEGRIPNLPNLPYSERLPDPAAVVDDVYEFRTRLLTSRRKFAKDLLDAVSPVFKTEETTSNEARPVSSVKKSA